MKGDNTMKSNSKAVMDKVRNHVSSFYSSLDDLRHDALACIPTIKHGPESMYYYKGGSELASDGSFLIPTVDVVAFLESLDLNGSEKKYTDDQSWEMYKHLCGRAVESLLR